MSLPPKVLWSEGLALGPHQLQQQDRYHEARLQRLARALHPHPWGVNALRWKPEALANRLLSVQAIALIFPDGECYEAPGVDQLPAPVDLSKLPPAEQAFTFCAALSDFKEHGANVSPNERFQNGTRHARHEGETPDLYCTRTS